jgi:hypothetical protein
MAPITSPTGRSVDPTQYKYYNQSFYNQKNPYDTFNADMGQEATGAYNNYNKLLGQAPWGGSGGAGFKWGGVNPNDSRINPIMSNLRGGQQSLLNQYTNQAANAGVSASRGGYGVGTNSSAAAQIGQQAISGLANQYSGNYWKTLNLLDQGDARMLGAYTSALGSTAGLAGNLANTRLGGVQGSADWLSKLLGMQREDYGKDVGVQQGWETQAPELQERYRLIAKQQQQEQLQQQQQQLQQQQADAKTYAQQYLAAHPQGTLNDPEYTYPWLLLRNSQNLKQGLFSRV